MTAILFALIDIETRQVRGQAMVCADAQYAAIRWAGAGHLDRRYGMPRHWMAVSDEIARGIPPAALPTGSAIGSILLVDTDVAVQYVAQEPVTVDEAGVAALLDARLLGA